MPPPLHTVNTRSESTAPPSPGPNFLNGYAAGRQGFIRPYDHRMALLQRAMDVFLIMACLLLVVTQLGPATLTPGYVFTALLAMPLFFLGARNTNLYHSFRIDGIGDEIRPLLTSWVIALAGLLALGYVFKITHDFSRYTLGLWAVITPIAMLLMRYVIRRLLTIVRARGFNTRSVVIVGANENAQHLASNILANPGMGLSLKGFVSDLAHGSVGLSQDQSVEVIGKLEALFAMARRNEVDVVYIATSYTDRETLERIIGELGDTTVSMYLVPDFYTASIMQGSWISVGDCPTVNIIDNANVGLDSWAKRVEDIVVASVALAVLALPMLLIACGVKLSSPGPVLYKQRRYGANGTPIDVWKFRSMSVTESPEEFVQAKKGDTRITPLGAFLRKTSMDEFPQFINVLLGDMSIVGPRPHAVAHNEEFRGKIKGYMLRHKVKPGITGLAQINGLRGETDTDDKMAQRVRYDVEYINHWSLWLDVSIILQTPISLLKNKDAY